MKLPPIKCPPAWVVVDVGGRVCWGLVFTDKREASHCARHPGRRIARVVVDEFCIVRKSPRKARKVSRG